jgi:hypothetical protein
MALANQKAVLFIDVLGFASLVRTHPLDIDDLAGQERISHHIDNILAHRENRLTAVFWNFHHSLKWAVETARLSHSITAISFSDSAFVATDRLPEVVEIAIKLTQSLLGSGIPARAGIACGTFAALRFKSDIGLDSGEHSAHFLGTAVVGAHEAESSGPKGVRILLHPSVLPYLDQQLPVIELPAHEQNPVGVRHEIDYWSFNVTGSRKAWHSIQRLWTDAPPLAQIHYESTADAVNRMRVRQGFERMSNLRKRTLTNKRASGSG